MKRFLKWALVVVLTVVAVVRLRRVPVFHPAVLHHAARGRSARRWPTRRRASTDIADPAERAIAARGRYIVMTTGCIGCHATNGSQGPDLSKYLAGGALKIQTPHGTFISRNLTPDQETGLGRRTDDEVKRVLRSGTFPDGHVVPGTAMPWPLFSSWSEEDRHAVVVYLRHLKPIAHRIPDPVTGNAVTIAGAIEQDYAGKDYGVAPKP